MGLKLAGEAAWLWGKMLEGYVNYIVGESTPKKVFFGNPIAANPAYLVGDRKTMDLCEVPFALQAAIATGKPVPYLVDQVISLPSMIGLWNEEERLYWLLLHHGYAEEEWRAGKVSLVQLISLWQNKRPTFLRSYGTLPVGCTGWPL